MTDQVRRTSGGRRDDDLPGEFTIVAVPGTHRANPKYGTKDGNGRHRGAKNRLNMAQKQKILLEARVRGLSWRQAGKEAGYRSVGAAYEAGQKAITDIPREAADEARSIEMQRLDTIIRSNWAGMLRGERDASFVILKAVESRRHLLGLDLAEPPDVLQVDVQLQTLLVGLLTMPEAEFDEREAEMSRLFNASQRSADRPRRASGAIASGE